MVLAIRDSIRRNYGVGLEPEGRDWLLHNPRGVSTVLFLALRRLLGRRADGAVRALLAAFDLLGRLPTRAATASFQAVAARRVAAVTTERAMLEADPGRGVQGRLLAALRNARLFLHLVLTRRRVELRYLRRIPDYI
jgi:hypothetical protein